MTKMVLVIYESFIGTLSTFIHINTIMHSCVHISVIPHCPKFQHLFIYSSSCQRNNVTSTILYNLHHTTSPLCLFLFYWHLYIVYSLEQCYFILEIHVFQQLLCYYYFILSFTSWIPVKASYFWATVRSNRSLLSTEFSSICHTTYQFIFMYTPKKYFTNDYRVNSCFSEIWDGIYSCKCCWPEPFNSFLRPFKAVFIVTDIKTTW